MDCSVAREHLSDLVRGRVDAATAEAVRVHAEACAACAAAMQAETRMRAFVRAQAPRYVAPAALRTRIQALLGGQVPARAVPRTTWLHRLTSRPWTVAALAGAAAVLLVVWGASFWLARDPLVLFLDRAVAEHSEYVKDTMTRPAADPLALVSGVRSQVDFRLEPVFLGDARVQLVTGTTSDLRGRRAATFVYRDASGRYTTLFLMPEAGLAIPTEGRMPIEGFKPYHRVASGRQLLLWKQGNLACLLVSDLDEAGIASMFLKVRKAA
jgi:anti-sigma factor (TIGR02949 family)